MLSWDQSAHQTLLKCGQSQVVRSARCIKGRQGGRIVARVLSNSTLIFLLDQPNSPPTLWKITPIGGGLTQLMAAQTTDMQLDFASSSYLPWSITSHDGRLYALKVSNQTSNAQSLVVGDLSGGLPKTIASSASSLLLVGWAEL